MCRRGRLAGNMGTEAEEEGKGGRKAHLRAQPTKKQMQAMRQFEQPPKKVCSTQPPKKVCAQEFGVVLPIFFSTIFFSKKEEGVQWSQVQFIKKKSLFA